MQLSQPSSEAFYIVSPDDMRPDGDDSPALIFPDGHRIHLSDNLFQAMLHLVEAANSQTGGRPGSVVQISLWGHEHPDYSAGLVIDESKDEIFDAIERGELTPDPAGMISIEQLLRFRAAQHDRRQQGLRDIQSARPQPPTDEP